MQKRTMGTALCLSVVSFVLCTVGMLEAQDGGTMAAVDTEEQVEVAVGSADSDSEEASASVGEAAVEREAGRPVLRGLRREDALYAAQACAHESSWRGGIGGTFDCGAQLAVFLSRRRTGEHLREVIARTMPRFATGRTSRAWVLHLPAGPMREDPPGWPALYPARHDADAWRSVFLRVEGFLRGQEPLPCTGVEQWFGRVTDSERLSAMLATGRWIEADCSPDEVPAHETLNSYLRRVVSVGAAAAGP